MIDLLGIIKANSLGPIDSVARSHRFELQLGNARSHGFELQLGNARCDLNHSQPMCS